MNISLTPYGVSDDVNKISYDKEVITRLDSGNEELTKKGKVIQITLKTLQTIAIQKIRDKILSTPIDNVIDMSLEDMKIIVFCKNSEGYQRRIYTPHITSKGRIGTSMCIKRTTSVSYIPNVLLETPLEIYN